MSKKRIRAQLRKANNNHANGKHDDMFDSYVLPATAEAYEQMVEQVAKAIRREDPLYEEWDAPTSLYYKLLSRAALRAIGIAQPKKGRK